MTAQSYLRAWARPGGADGSLLEPIDGINEGINDWLIRLIATHPGTRFDTRRFSPKKSWMIQLLSLTTAAVSKMYCQDFYRLYSAAPILQQVVAKSVNAKRRTSKMPQAVAKSYSQQLADLISG